MLCFRSSRKLSIVLAALVAFAPLISAAKINSRVSMDPTRHEQAGAHAHHAHAQMPRTGSAVTSISDAGSHAHGQACDASGGCSSSCCAACAHCLAVVPVATVATERPTPIHGSAAPAVFDTLTVSPQIRPPQIESSIS